MKRIFKILTTLLIISNCRTNKSELLQENSSYDAHEIGNTYNAQEPQDSHQRHSKKVLIVMIHGLAQQENIKLVEKIFIDLRLKLQSTYPKSDIKYLFINLGHSLYDGIEKQGRIVIKQIDEYFLKHPQQRNTNILIVGHCVGAMSGLEAYLNSKNRYNYKGIISASSPWHGAEVVYENIEKKNENFTFLFHLVVNPYFKKVYNKDAPSMLNLVPKGEYIINLEKKINSVEIPIWSVGAKSNYMNEFFSMSIFKILSKDQCNLEYLTYGSNNTDGLITLDSQLGIGYDKITSIKIKENAYHSTASKMVILEKMHSKDRVLKSLLSEEDYARLFYVEKEKSIMQTDEYFSLLKAFIEKYGLENDKKNISDNILIKDSLKKSQ